MFILASLICPNTGFVSDMETANASTLTCSQHSWVSDTKIRAQTLLFHLILSLCLTPNLGSSDSFSPGDLCMTALQWMQT